ncbi:MAG: hypothetical protein ABEH64_00865 [Salinirussus sp.]
MERSELVTAAERLESAASATEAGADRLGDLADQLNRLATAERGPDHGRLARIQAALEELRDSVADGALDDINAADDAIDAYREDLEGV